jgi:hypothetical protein
MLPSDILNKISFTYENTTLILPELSGITDITSLIDVIKTDDIIAVKFLFNNNRLSFKYKQIEKAILKSGEKGYLKIRDYLKSIIDDIVPDLIPDLIPKMDLFIQYLKNNEIDKLLHELQEIKDNTTSHVLYTFNERFEFIKTFIELSNLFKDEDIKKILHFIDETKFNIDFSVDDRLILININKNLSQTIKKYLKDDYCYNVVRYIIKLALQNDAFFNNSFEIEKILNSIPFEFKEYIIKNFGIPHQEMLEINEFSNSEILDIIYSYFPLYMEKSSLHNIIKRNNLNLIKKFFENNNYDINNEILDDDFINGIVLANSLNYDKTVNYFYSILVKNKKSNEIDKINEKLKKLIEIDVNEKSKCLSKNDKHFDFPKILSEQINILKDLILKNKIEEFLIVSNNIYNFYDKKNFHHLYSEQICLDLMITIVKNISNINENDLNTILEKFNIFGILDFRFKNLKTLYDETVLSGNTQLKNFMYEKYQYYFIYQLIDNIIDNNQKDFNFLISVIPENILQNYSSNQISQGKIDDIFLKSTSIKMLKKINEILNFHIDNSTLLAAIKSTEINNVKYILEDLLDVEYFKNIMSEAIELAKELKLIEIISYLKNISNSQYAKN